MSERGIEIHNGEVVFPEGMPQEFHLGTLASPLTQGEAAQVVLSAVINAIALGGAVVAGLVSAHGTVSLTGSLTGLRVRTVVDAAIVVTGYNYGLHIEQEVHAAGQVTTLLEGIRLEQYVPTGGVTKTVYGIHVSNYIQTQPTQDYFFARFSENGGVTVEAAFYLDVGGGGDITNLFFLASGHTAWGANTAPGGAVVGRIAVWVGGLQRYIGLYTG